jgi:3-oxoacyl-[acyl-carrier protein] reductase
VIEGARLAPAHPELAGKRVLITGLTSTCGVDIARAFADHKTRLILQFDESSQNMEAVAEIVAPTALEIQCFGPVGGDSDEEVVKFARSAATTFSGLDVVINLVPLTMPKDCAVMSVDDVEDFVAGRLRLPCLLSNIAANRMAMCMNEGLILNVAVLPRPLRGPSQAMAMLTKAALVSMTRQQADEWADRAVRFNAVAPQTSQSPAETVLAGETDIAAVALFLASGRANWLSGQVFEAEPAPQQAFLRGLLRA